jgi:arabinose-5-phosphate isomerase
MLKKILEESQSYLCHFFETVDVKRWEEIIDLCFSTRGLLVFTGMGKSGIVAEKIAATLTSTGTKALYIPAANFLHGDIGILSENDLVFMLSKSGESEELLQLIPFLQRKKVGIIGVVSQSTSRLAKACHLCMVLPVQKELCSFDLVPTTSSEVQLIFGDILAVALMKKRNFQLDDYALNHPAGTIGKKMTLYVKDLMFGGEKVPFCYPENTLENVLVELSSKRCGMLIVVDQAKKLKGVFTDGDLRRALQAHGSDVLKKTMQELMTPTAICVLSHMLVWDAMKEMQKNPNKWVTVTPVIEGEKVVGILRMHDIVQSGIV